MQEYGVSHIRKGATIIAVCTMYERPVSRETMRTGVLDRPLRANTVRPYHLDIDSCGITRDVEGAVPYNLAPTLVHSSFFITHF